jgi:hypothetical protein
LRGDIKVVVVVVSVVRTHTHEQQEPHRYTQPMQLKEHTPRLGMKALKLMQRMRKGVYRTHSGRGGGGRRDSNYAAFFLTVFIHTYIL